MNGSVGEITFADKCLISHKRQAKGANTSNHVAEAFDKWPLQKHKISPTLTGENFSGRGEEKTSLIEKSWFYFTGG